MHTKHYTNTHQERFRTSNTRTEIIIKSNRHLIQRGNCVSEDLIEAHSTSYQLSNRNTITHALILSVWKWCDRMMPSSSSKMSKHYKWSNTLVQPKIFNSNILFFSPSLLSPNSNNYISLDYSLFVTTFLVKIVKTTSWKIHYTTLWNN